MSADEDPRAPRPVRTPPTLGEMRGAYQRLLNMLAAGNRLSAQERRALRWLRRQPGVHQPETPREHAAIAKALVKRERRALGRLREEHRSTDVTTPEAP